MTQCGANKRNCPCGYKYMRTDAKGFGAKCPKCAASRPCGQRAMSNGRCSRHGGKSPSGTAHPNFETGLYAKDLPHNMLEIFQQLQSDEELLKGMSDLRLMYTRLKLLLRSNNSLDVFADLQSAWNRFEQASRMPDGGDADEAAKAVKQAKQDAMNAALAGINALIRKGKGEAGRWQEIYSISDRLVRLRESERRRLLDEQTSLSAERAMLLITMITNSVIKRVKDSVDQDIARGVLNGVSLDLMQILGPIRGASLLGSGGPLVEQPDSTASGYRKDH